MTRSTRDRPAKAPLSLAAVVDAALVILQTEGLDAVSMRRVANALDTGAASLYVYVANRDALLQAMLDRILGTIELDPPDPARWREQLHALLARMRRTLAAHPGIAVTAMTAAPASDAALLLMDNLLGLLAAGGVAAQDAAWTADVLASLVSHAAIEQDARGEDFAEQAQRFGATFAALPAERFPQVVAHAKELVTGDGDERFDFAVDVVIDGLRARGARKSG